MARVGIGLGILLISCGGAATPKAEAPEPAAKAAPQEEKAPADKADNEDAKPSDGEKTAEAADKGTSEEELKTILQLVIEDAELDKYLHLEEPGRFPLKMAGHDVPSGISLMKAGQPVQIVQGEPSKKDAVLVVTKIDVEGPKASVDYRYDVEGVFGTARLKKASYGWELSSSNIVEHYRSDSGKL